MTHSHPSSTPAPMGHTDASRGGHRQPYPNASTPAASPRHSVLRAGIRRHVRTGSMAPTPATVWACGPTPIDPDATWPTPILTKIVTSFSKPGDRVLLLPWPTTAPRPRHAPTQTAGPGDQLAAAGAVIEGLDRTARVIPIQVDPNACGPASRPFWDDLLHTTPSPRRPGTGPLPGSAPGAAANRLDTATATADLIITNLRPEHSGDRTSDHVALLAARLLRVGGTLTVLTHSGWSRGELVDPTGPMVACAQNADLLYLQHIVALHTPIHRGHLLSHSHKRPAPPRNQAPHYRISSDVLVFAQPHDHQPPPLPPTTVPAPWTRS